MYDELVKKLRELASIPEYCEKVANCDQCPKEDICLSFTNKRIIETATQAADTIEGLSHAVDQMTEWRKNPWIPVAERLPEKTNHYLVHVKCGCDGKFASAWEQVAWFCEKFYWEHLHGDDVFKETITHWMPLPEPPEEE